MTYITHNPTKKQVVQILKFLFLPPNSPPILGRRRITNSMMAAMAKQQNTVTLNANEPGFTSKGLPSMACFTDAIVQAIPMPRKTLTALLPVTFPIEESA